MNQKAPRWRVRQNPASRGRAHPPRLLSYVSLDNPSLFLFLVQTQQFYSIFLGCNLKKMYEYNLLFFNKSISLLGMHLDAAHVPSDKFWALYRKHYNKNNLGVARCTPNIFS